MTIPLRIKFPSSITINGSTWSINQLRTVDHPEIADGWIAHTWGYCDIERKRLEVLKRLGDRNKLRTLVHELFHAIEEEYDLQLEHKVLDAFSIAIADTLISNFLGETP